MRNTKPGYLVDGGIPHSNLGYIFSFEYPLIKPESIIQYLSPDNYVPLISCARE